MDEVLAIATEGRAVGLHRGALHARRGARGPPRRSSGVARRPTATRRRSSTSIAAARAVVLETGLLPHANPGAVTAGRDEGAARGHRVAGRDDGAARRPAADAGRGARGRRRQGRRDQARAARDRRRDTRTPFTTGFLIGIGETLEERASTIVQLADAVVGRADPPQVHEVIVQNFRAKPDTPMRAHDDASEGEMLRAIAATRLVFGPRMSVQAPPNLTPKTYGRYLDAGINDWGGVSPVTPDHVNPEMPWPRDRRARRGVRAARLRAAPAAAAVPALPDRRARLRPLRRAVDAPARAGRFRRHGPRARGAVVRR